MVEDLEDLGAATGEVMVVWEDMVVAMEALGIVMVEDWEAMGTDMAVMVCPRKLLILSDPQVPTVWGVLILPMAVLDALEALAAAMVATVLEALAEAMVADLEVAMVVGMDLLMEWVCSE